MLLTSESSSFTRTEYERAKSAPGWLHVRKACPNHFYWIWIIFRGVSAWTSGIVYRWCLQRVTVILPLVRSAFRRFEDLSLQNYPSNRIKNCTLHCTKFNVRLKLEKFP